MRPPIDSTVLHMLDRVHGTLRPVGVAPIGSRILDRLEVCRAIREAGGHLRDAAHALGLAPEHLVTILEHDVRVAIPVAQSGVRRAITQEDIAAFEERVEREQGDRPSDGDRPAWQDDEGATEAACGGRKRG